MIKTTPVLTICFVENLFKDTTSINFFLIKKSSRKFYTNPISILFAVFSPHNLSVAGSKH